MAKNHKVLSDRHSPPARTVRTKKDRVAPSVIVQTNIIRQQKPR